MKKIKSMTFRFTEEEVALLKDLAALVGVSRTAIVRVALKEYDKNNFPKPEKISVPKSNEETY